VSFGRVVSSFDDDHFIGIPPRCLLLEAFAFGTPGGSIIPFIPLAVAGPRDRCVFVDSSRPNVRRGPPRKPSSLAFSLLGD